MAEDIIIRYRAETDEFLKELNVLIDKQDQLADEAEKTAKSFDKSATNEVQAAKRRQQAVEAELKNIERLKQARARAFDPVLIDRFNRQIQQAESRIKSLGNAVDDAGKKTKNTFNQVGEILGKQGNVIKNIGLGIAAGIAGAFSVEEIISFSKKSIDAFLVANKAVTTLRNNIIGVGGESEEAFNRLVEQAEQIQKVTTFSKDTVVQAQAALAAFGLTSEQIEELIPRLADFATISNTDLLSAVQQVGAGLEGAGKGFKKYGIEVDANKTRLENLNSILQGFVKFQGAAERATDSVSGKIEQQKNKIEDLQAAIGERLIGLQPKLSRFKLFFTELFASIVGVKDQTALEKATEGFGKIAAGANVLFETLKKGNLSTEVRAGLIKELNEQYKDYLPNLLTEKSSYEELAKAQEAVNQNIKDRITLVALEEEIAKLTKNAAGAITGLITVEKERTKLQGQLIDNAQAVKTKTDQLNNTEAVYKEILNNVANTIGDLQKRYQDLLNKLGLNKKETEENKTATEELRKEFEKINAITPGTSLAYQNLTDRQLILLRLVEKLYINFGEFREEVKKLNQEFQSNAVKDFEEDLDKLNKKKLETFSSGFEPALPDTRTWLEKNEEILQSSLDLFQQLSALSNAFTQQRIDDLNLQLEKVREVEEEQLTALEESKEKRLISEADFEKRSASIKQQRIAAEKKIQAEINKQKRKQAVLEKANATFEIILNTAIAISKALGNLPLQALIAALGAAQLATVLAQPIPAFAKGTKGKKGSGMALVGEQGAEMTFLPDGAKVLPAKQTKTYGEVFDAMYDNRFEKYVMQKYVAPALEEQKRKFEGRKQESFASNIVSSMQYNGITTSDLIYANSKGTKVKNADEIAQAIAKALKTQAPDLWRM